MQVRGAEGAAVSSTLSSAVLEAGDVVCMGIVGGLLSSFPLSRLHKAATVLAQLGALCGTASGQRAAAAAGQATTQLSLLSGFLSAGTRASSLSVPEQQSIHTHWPAATLEAAEGLRAPAREQGLASRKLKRLLRDFADMHTRESQ